jgi:hypothetical protein
MIRTRWKSAKICAGVWCFGILIAFSTFAAPVGDSNDLREPTGVVRAYLRAVYARDFAEAYRYISAEDRRSKDLNRYLRQRGPLNGFALEAARMLAAMVQVEITPTESSENRLRLTARYQAPDPEKVAPLLHGWNGYRLNALPQAERAQLVAAIESGKRNQSIDMISGEETIVLVKENDGWRIFLNWAAGISIAFQQNLSQAPALNVSLSPKQVVTQPGEIFEIALKITNRSDQPLITRVVHKVEPTELADYLEFVQCGFLLPLSLPPGREQEYFGTYLLRGSFPENVRELRLNYDFQIIDGAGKK